MYQNLEYVVTFKYLFTIFFSCQINKIRFVIVLKSADFFTELVDVFQMSTKIKKFRNFVLRTKSSCINSTLYIVCYGNAEFVKQSVHKLGFPKANKRLEIL